MVIKKININPDFPGYVAKMIDELIWKEEYSPIWQTPSWNEMLQKASYASKGTFIGVFDNEILVNYAIVEKRSVGLGFYGNFIIGGPINHLDIVNLQDEIIQLGKDEKVVFTQIENLNDINLVRFKNGAYKKFIEKYTAIISLKQSEEQILANMKQKGRYNIKVAEKNEIKVEKAKYNKENVSYFYSLLTETKSRDEFAINSIGYYEKFCEYLDKNNLGGIYFAKKDGEILAAGIFVFCGKYAIYYYGASTSQNEKRKFMPAYLLQWALIKEAKEKGCEIFDFLGISDPNSKDEKLAGVTDFKLKLTNETKIWPDSKIYVHNNFKYCILRLKAIIKKLRK